jgi:UPF0755 protein
MRRLAPLATRLSLAAFFILVVLAGGAVWAIAQLDRDGPAAAEQTVILDRGAGLKQIAETLAAAGVINRPWLMTAWVLLMGDADKLKAGEYKFEARASLKAVIDAIVAGRIHYRRLTIAEGATVADVLAQIAATEGLRGDLPPSPAEGSLLPETYLYAYGETREDVVERMHNAMERTKTELWPGRKPDLPYRSLEEAVTLASLIEKETAIPAERALIAGVFVNRLRLGMRLQSDPTVIYGLSQGHGRIDRPLRLADLDHDSPWNTYRIAGLPPTPIANPGRASLKAALNPETTDYLYFVADGSGGHVFSAKLREHRRNVAKWRSLENADNAKAGAEGERAVP